MASADRGLLEDCRTALCRARSQIDCIKVNTSYLDQAIERLDQAIEAIDAEEEDASDPKSSGIQLFDQDDLDLF